MQVVERRRKKSAESRREAHFTPADVVRCLLEDPAEPVRRRGGLWVDVGAGTGNIAAAAAALGFGERWVCVEPYFEAVLPFPEGADVRWVREHWVDSRGRPALSPELAAAVRGAAVVVMNPPFSLSEAFCELAFMVCPGAEIYALQARGWLDAARAQFFSSRQPDELVVPWRIPFVNPDGSADNPFPGLCSWYRWPPGGGSRDFGRLRVLRDCRAGAAPDPRGIDDGQIAAPLFRAAKIRV